MGTQHMLGMPGEGDVHRDLEEEGGGGAREDRASRQRNRVCGGPEAAAWTSNGTARVPAGCGGEGSAGSSVLRRLGGESGRGTSAQGA